MSLFRTSGSLPRFGLGFALVASLVSIWTGISVARIEIFTILLAGIVLHARLTWHQWIGGAIVVGGAAILVGERDLRSD